MIEGSKVSFPWTLDKLLVCFLLELFKPRLRGYVEGRGIKECDSSVACLLVHIWITFSWSQTYSAISFPVIKLNVECFYSGEGNKDMLYWFFSFFFPVRPLWDYSQDGRSSGSGLTANKPLSLPIHFVPPLPLHPSVKRRAPSFTSASNNQTSHRK